MKAIYRYTLEAKELFLTDRDVHKALCHVHYKVDNPEREFADHVRERSKAVLKSNAWFYFELRKCAFEEVLKLFDALLEKFRGEE